MPNAFRRFSLYGGAHYGYGDISEAIWTLKFEADCYRTPLDVEYERQRNASMSVHRCCVVLADDGRCWASTFVRRMSPELNKRPSGIN